ncbi:MAG: ABC transporter ATP-binding protein [Ancalomicrobiaceae bacterium]|nr:ABC transporter ATP-binding protein [Ancalomicrobiaceae bacterium]
MADTSQAASAPGRGLVLDGIYKGFGAVDVLTDINLSVDEGEFIVFVGPSGCGKSTLLRLVAGLEQVSEGAISIGGRDVTEVDPAMRGIAMVFQSYALYPHLSVAENMGFSLRMAGRPKAEIAAKVAAAAAKLHLTPLLDRRPAQLSGGQRQRVAIGRAIVRDPKIFLFDEPLSNLDAELRIEMRIEIAKLHRQLGNTMIYVTHDQTEAMTLADRIVVLRAGRIEQVGTPAAIYGDPDNLFVAGFIGTPKINVIPAVTDAGALICEGHRFELPADFAARHGDLPVRIGVRPDLLRIAGGDEPGLEADVDVVEYLGDAAYVHAQTQHGARVVHKADRSRLPQTGDRLRLTFDADGVHVFDDNGQRLR